MARARLTLPILAVLLAAPCAARAGETACWFDGGVVVVPASVAGIAGDFILDTGQARTELHETRAQAEGIEVVELVGPIRVAGLSLADRRVVVADLDVRGWNLPTPIAGVIGADILKDYVVDVSFAPCRVRVSAPGDAPLFKASQQLALSWDEGRPVVSAAASDGVRTLRGGFVVASGANTAARLADDVAQVPDVQQPAELSPQGRWLARLAELRFAGRTLRDQGAGLMPPLGQTAGTIGGPALAGFRLRFDFPAGRLLVAPAR